MRYYTFHVKDYQIDTARLDLMEDLAYRRMLDWVFLNERPLPSSSQEIGRAIGMRSHEECINYILETFWVLTDEGYIQPRAAEVLAKIYQKSEKARASAKARWERKANAMRTHSEGNATPMLPINPLTNTNNPSSSEASASDDDEAAKKSQKAVAARQRLEERAAPFLDLAQWMFGRLQVLDPEFKQPDLHKWADQLRLMVEQDKRSKREIALVFNWANTDPFWKTNILSPGKLRKQFDQLKIKMNTGGPNGQQPGGDRRTESQKRFDSTRDATFATDF